MTSQQYTTKQIYLIRHGQTEFNKKGIVQGSGIDVGLNAIGRVQANAFYQTYKHIDFDKVYTSVLKRSIESVQGFLELNIPHEAHIGLNEISWGDKEGRPTTPEENQAYHDMLAGWQKGDLHLKSKGGESPIEVQTRQKKVLDVILSRPEEQNILICMHGRAMRIFLCLMLSYPLQEMDRFEHSNLCLYKIHYTGSMFAVESFNDTEHLKTFA